MKPSDLIKAAIDDRKSKEEDFKQKLKTPSFKIKHLLTQKINSEDDCFLINGCRLKRGTIFKAKGGPYYLKEEYEGNGWWKYVKIDMAEKGPFIFRTLKMIEGRLYIVASNKDRAFCLLCLSKEHSSKSLDSLIKRPYKVIKVVTTLRRKK